jgi:hypothetical protein
MTDSVRSRTLSAALAATIVVLLLATGFATATGPNGEVRGYVTDSVSAAAVPGASVRIEATDLPWIFGATTDAAGFFQVSVPAHRYTLWASGPAHLGATMSLAVGTGDITWANVTLPPAASRSSRLQGFVTDSVSLAPVTVGRVVVGPTTPSTSVYTNSSALNATGYYALDLVPWTYMVSNADMAGYDPYTYYPLSVSAGQVRWFNFTVDPNPVDAWINGSVRDDDTWAPIVGATVTGIVDGVQLATVTTDAFGDYGLPTQAGNVDIVADAPGYAPVTTNRYVWSGGTTYEDFRLMAIDHAIRGFAVDGITGARLPGVLVTATPFWSDGYFDQTVTDGNGYYDIPLPQDDFSIAASLTGYTTWSTYIFSFSGPVVWANATLWPIISTVSGYLVEASNGSPVSGLGVNGMDVRTAYARSSTSDGTGFFTFPMTPSPAITIYVYGTAVYAGNVAYAGTRPYETTWVNITLERLTAQVVATVTDAISGLPIQSATVSVSWSYGWDFGTSDAGGVALVDAAAGLDVQVSASAPGYLWWYRLATTVAGTNPIAIELYPNVPEDVWVRGYVNDSGGVGIWSGTVEAFGYGPSAPYDYTAFDGYYELYIVARPQTIRASSSGYEVREASVNPGPAETLWLNFTLPLDLTDPVIESFTATPATGISETSPAALLADVNETSLEWDFLSILMLRGTVGNVGTFLYAGRLDPATVTTARVGPDAFTVSSSWNTRTRLGRFTDGVASAWWPVLPGFSPFLVGTNGYFDNATISPTPGAAMFDARDGRLLYVTTGGFYVDARDQPTSTFTPYTSGIRIDMTTAAIVGASLETAPAFTLATLSATISTAVPSGQYAALLEVWDASNRYDAAAVLLRTDSDTVPPVASAGADRTVDEDTPVAFDGTASTDNVGIASYTWAFIDGGAQVLSGPSPTYTFANPGTYVVTLTVADADGNTDTDAFTVTVLDATDPSVSITAPADGAVIRDSVLVTATATDNVAVVRVEFFLDGVSKGDDTAGPWSLAISLAGVPNGNHTLEVVAHDAAGNSATATRMFRVDPAGTPGGGDPPATGPDLVLFGGIALVSVAGILGALLLVRRRRRRRPAALPPTVTTPERPQ